MANRLFILLATFQCGALALFSRPTPTVCFLFAGVVSERSREMAANGDEAGKQNGGEVLAGCFARDGDVPRADVAASPQSSVQRDGGSPQSQFDGLSIATILRLMSAVKLDITIKSATSSGTLDVWCRKLVDRTTC